MNKSLEILKKYWGYDSFRPMQQEIVNSAIYGHDTLALLSTGAGKSICFQVPGILREGICLVVSPLIALMQDQVQNLRKKGIKAEFIVSGMSARDIDIILDNVRFGNVKFLYTSPERLKSRIFIERFKLMNIGLIAVDEAHCISQWGFDFRPPYLHIADLRDIHPNVPIIAVTATATQQVKIDISEKLKLQDFNYFEGDFARKNITYKVFPSVHKEKDIVNFVFKYPRASGIIYCQTRKSTKEIAKLLNAQGVNSTFYHGGLTKEERTKRQKSWIENKVSVIVATNAFGMGIDKPDVRFVLHYEFPDSLEAYYQEAGRGGRDGEPAVAMAFLEKEDIPKIEKKVKDRFPELEQVKLVYRALCNFLNIAIGAGVEETYPFDIKQFIDKYDFDLLEVYHALQILELNESVSFSSNALSLTRVKFAVTNITLYNFQLQNEKLDPLISLISRSYTGVFEQFAAIDEMKIAKRLSISSQQLLKQLEYLEKNGILEVSWRSSLPQVTFLNERLPDSYFSIAPRVLVNRKTTALKKLDAVKQYLSEKTCRSIQLLRYFGQKGNACGLCDVCVNEHDVAQIGTMLNRKIQVLLQGNSFTFEELTGLLSSYDKNFINKKINQLIDEKMILIDKKNKLTWKKIK